ncbi:unnamed protein product [Caretta caretta]
MSEVPQNTCSPGSDDMQPGISNLGMQPAICQVLLNFLNNGNAMKEENIRHLHDFELNLLVQGTCSESNILKSLIGLAALQKIKVQIQQRLNRSDLKHNNKRTEVILTSRATRVGINQTIQIKGVQAKRRKSVPKF